MRTSKILRITFFGLFAGVSMAQAQNTISAAGSNATGSGGSVSYTVGQIAYSTSTATNGSVAQGVQQPYEISVLTGTDEATDISLLYAVYPNPVSDILTLSIKGSIQPEFIASLFDAEGKLLRESRIVTNETRINMSPFPGAAYLLVISREKPELSSGSSSGQTIKTFRIIKN